MRWKGEFVAIGFESVSLIAKASHQDRRVVPMKSNERELDDLRQELADQLQTVASIEQSLPTMLSGWRREMDGDVERIEDIEKKLSKMPLDYFSLDCGEEEKKWRTRPFSDNSGSFKWSLELAFKNDDLSPLASNAELGDRSFQFVAIAISRWCVFVLLKVVPISGKKCPKLVFKSNPTRSLIRLNYDDWCLPCNGGNIDDPVLRRDGELRFISFPPISRPVAKFEITFGELTEQSEWQFNCGEVAEVVQKALESKSLAARLREGLEAKFEEMKAETEQRIHNLRQKVKSQLSSIGGSELAEPKTWDGKWPF